MTTIAKIAIVAIRMNDQPLFLGGSTAAGAVCVGFDVAAGDTFLTTCGFATGVVVAVGLDAAATGLLGVVGFAAGDVVTWVGFGLGGRGVVAAGFASWGLGASGFVPDALALATDFSDFFFPILISSSFSP
jgi:hypothetical protein